MNKIHKGTLMLQFVAFVATVIVSLSFVQTTALAQSTTVVDINNSLTPGWGYTISQGINVTPGSNSVNAPYTFEWRGVANRNGCSSSTTSGWTSYTGGTTSGGSFTGTITLDSESFNGQHLCYRVTGTGGARVFYFLTTAMARIDRVRPSATITVTNASNTTASVALRYAEEKSGIATAGYKVVSQASECQTTSGYTSVLGSLSGTSASLDRSATVTLTRQSTDRIICSRMTDLANNNSVVNATMARTSGTITTPPSSGDTIVDINNSLTPGWGYTISQGINVTPGSNSVNAPYTFEWRGVANRNGCSSSTTSGWTSYTGGTTSGGSFTGTITLDSESFNGQHLCYRVTGTGGARVFYFLTTAMARIDRVRPSATITVTNASNTTASVALRYAEEKSGIATAGYKVVSQASECQTTSGYTSVLGSLSGTSASLDRSATVTLTRQSTDRIICSRMTDLANNNSVVNATMTRENVVSPPSTSNPGGGGGGGSNDPRGPRPDGDNDPRTPVDVTEECGKVEQIVTLVKQSLEVVQPDTTNSLNFLFAPGSGTFATNTAAINYITAPLADNVGPYMYVEKVTEVILNPCDPEETPEPEEPVVVETTDYVLEGLFRRCLFEGSYGEDVRLLQRLLNISGFTVADKDEGSIGKETTYFGPLTKAALKTAQEYYNIPVTGIFDLPTIDVFVGIAYENGYTSFELNDANVEEVKEYSDTSYDSKVLPKNTDDVKSIFGKFIQWVIDLFSK